MMVDSVVWAQYINVTDRHTDSHVATANATPTHCCIGRKKHAACALGLEKPYKDRQVGPVESQVPGPAPTLIMSKTTAARSTRIEQDDVLEAGVLVGVKS